MFYNEIRFFHKFFIALQFFWVLIAACGFAFNVYQSNSEVLDLAKRTAFLIKTQNDTLKKWALHQSEMVRSSALDEKNILSPAKILSQIQSFSPDKGVKSRFISPFPINPLNYPDKWEKEIFAKLQNKEPIRIKQKQNREFLYREIHPMVSEERCMNCHPEYKVNTVSGALSIIVPLAPVWSMLLTRYVVFNISCFFVWILGALGINYAKKQIYKHFQQRQKLQSELHYSNNLYNALSASNQAMVRINNQEELYQEICLISVKFGQFQLASVSLVDKESTELYPVASFGDKSYCKYVERVKVGTDPAHPEGRGPTSLAIRERRTVITNNFLKDLAGSPWEKEARQAGIQSSAALPIYCSDKVIGALKIYSSQRDFFTPSRTTLLEQLRDDLSFALMSSELKKRELQVQKELLDSQKFNQVLLNALPYIAILASYSTNKVVNANRKALEAGVVIGESSPYCQTIPNQALNRSGTIEKKNKDDRWEKVCWKPVDSEGQDLYLHYAIDVTARKNQEEKMYSKAHTDPLTGVTNRRYLSQLINKVISEEKTCEFSLVVIDLDKFKPINDTYGHSAGDQVLIKVAERLKKALRTEDTVCRWGGDEFVLFLSNSSTELTEKILSRVLNVFKEPFRILDFNIPISASIGYARYPDDANSEGELFKLADKRMYRNKMGQLITFPVREKV